ADVVPMLEDMNRLASLMRARRVKHGAIDFDLPEADIILDEDGRTKDVRLHERNDATRLIEDFMLAANAAVAETFAVLHMPFLYRTHEEPDAEKISELALFVSTFGYHIKLKKDDKTSSKELQKLMSDTAGTDAERLIRSLTLRSMKQARYTTECEGHFGLAMQYYTHFTSPIRRYPDLQIHRIIKEYLRNELTEKRIAHYNEILPKAADRSSFLERRADDVERDADKLKMVEYMAGHIGEEYDGFISGVTDWGIYVELENTIEGMIPLRDMTDDYYELDDVRHLVKGRASGHTYRLGENIRVQVLRADKLSCEIDMAVVD
nr:RNB domain-containing ribonuclease [Lachnospiraceae bacterium]